MAKDYFQDITPPPASPDPSRASLGRPAPPPPRPPVPPAEPPISEVIPTPPPHELGKSIRNIPITVSRSRPRYDDVMQSGAPPPQRRGSRLWLWGGIFVALLALAAIALVALRPTSVFVSPRSHAILFDDTARFMAYPASSAAEGSLAFTVESTILEDSQVVAAEGTVRVEEKANGSVTIYNDYSADSVKLIKNTRFESSQGLIFRVPAEAIVPGKRGTVPGEITVMVIADQAGEKYNIGPDTFKLPGLKSTPDMFAKVTARSTTAMTGGFAGERAAIAPSTEEATRAEIRSRLEQKVKSAIGSAAGDNVVFVELARISYETLPPTSETGGSVRMHERAVVEMPVFAPSEFAHILARSVSADAESGDVKLVPGEGFRAMRLTPTDVPLTAPLEFTLEGTARLVWVVDEAALKSALAGKSEDAFQSIVEGFPSIDEAHARIEPFWKNSFPSDPSAIQITIEDPSE